MTGWFALVLIVAVVIATAAIFAAGRKAGVAAEAATAREAELKSQKEAYDAKGRMLEAGAAAPNDRDALAEPCLAALPQHSEPLRPYGNRKSVHDVGSTLTLAARFSDSD